MYGWIAVWADGSTYAGLTLSARKDVGSLAESSPSSASISPFVLAKIGENRPGVCVAPSPDTWINLKGWSDGLMVENAVAAAKA